jgi:hypothetical protein
MDPKLFSQLTHAEAKLIRDKAFSQAKKQNMHLLLDQVSISQSGANYALSKNGVVKGVVLSTKAENALRRSFERGNEIGRYEDTVTLLQCHQSSPKLALDHAISNMGKNVHVEFFDNNVNLGEVPNAFLEIDCAKREVVIHNESLLKEFMKKQFINPQAKTYKDIYAPMTEKSLMDAMNLYIEQLKGAGYSIKNVNALHLLRKPAMA